jgi:assimilatory nitrate reductase catalytic subunit
MYATTETARMADLVLPAAGWGEKDGILINSERRLGIIKKVSRAPGQALSDFAIFKLVADAWGCGDLFEKWSSPEATFQILKELSRGQPCEFTGISSYEHIDRAGGIQWPFTDQDLIGSSDVAAFVKTWPSRESTPANHVVTNAATATTSAADHSSFITHNSTFPAKERRLFADGKFFTPDRRAKFFFDQPRPMPELPDADYPMLLLTGRGSSAQWHTGSRTDKSDVLRKLAPRELYVEINPIDADRLRIDNNELVRVRSRRGEAGALALVTSTVQPGQVYLPMHFDTVNRLTFPSFDPHSRQPSYKACAVRVEKIKKK